LLNALAVPAKDSELKLRVMPPKNLHLTLKFLGSIEPEQEPALSTILSTVAAQQSKFQLSSGGVGFFKDSLWVGINPSNELSDLVSTLNESLAAIGLQPETKPYIPHVTVARFAIVAKPKLQRIASRFENTQWGEINVSKFHLYRSETLTSGAMYYIINKYELGGT